MTNHANYQRMVLENANLRQEIVRLKEENMKLLGAHDHYESRLQSAQLGLELSDIIRRIMEDRA